MTIARRLKWYLDAHHVDYDLIPHAHTSNSLASARAAHVPVGQVAKSVVLEDERGYVMAVVPASCRVELDEVDRAFGRHLELASEAELTEIFETCEQGAIPPVGEPFNIPSIVDQSLLGLPDVYFEAGDHEELVHLTGAAFRELFSKAPDGRFSRPG